MSVIRRQGIKNTVYTYLGIILGVLSTLYIQPFFLTKEQVGITRLIITVSAILTSFSCLGITGLVTRFFPLFHDSEKKHNGFFTVAVAVPLLGFALCLLFVKIFEEKLVGLYGNNGPLLSVYFWPIMLSALFNCLVFAFNAYCNAIQKSTIPTLINEVYNRVALIGCILLFSYGITTQNQYIYSLSAIFIVQMLLLLAAISVYDHPKINPTFFFNNTHLPEMVRYSLVATFMQIAGVCLKFIDIFFVGKYKDLDQVGVYSIAAFIGLVLETPLGAIEKIAGAKIARLFAAKDLKGIQKIYTLSSKYLMVFCGLLGCILVSCIEPTLGLLPGGYQEGTWVTIIICIGAFFNAATGVNYSILNYSNQYKLGALFYFGLLVLTCLLNIWLIPTFGIMGAAIATATASVLHNILRYSLIKWKLNMQPFTKDTLRILIIIPFTLLLACLISIDNPYLLIISRGAACVIVFVFLLILLKVFSIAELKEEFFSLKKTFF